MNYFLGTQLWKLSPKLWGFGNMLQNKEGLWISNEKWNFKPKDDLIYIENTSGTKVLGANAKTGKVIPEDFKEGKAHQLWKKGARLAYMDVFFG